MKRTINATSRTWLLSNGFRILYSIISMTVSILSNQSIVLYLSLAFMIYAISWMIIDTFPRFNADNFPFGVYMCIFIDNAMAVVWLYITGNINSFVILIFLASLSMNATNVKKWYATFNLYLSFASVAALFLLTYFNVIPKVNILGAGTEISLLAIIVVLLLLPLLSFQVYSTIRKIVYKNIELLEQARIEREKSDRLLLSILPIKVAEELKAEGKYRPSRIESATIMFTDFANFTQSIKNIDPLSVISQLNRYFTKFDLIAEKYGIERLKTVGDGYMCAGGIPMPNKTHSIDVCLAALEIIKVVNEEKKDKGLVWDIRIGIHSGPVIAGIVGSTKFSYDIWGETVNLASRHESAGMVGKVNVSKATYLLTKGIFDYQDRGIVNVKGYGDQEMYELCGLRKEYYDEHKAEANTAFKTVYEKIEHGKNALGFDV